MNTEIHDLDSAAAACGLPVTVVRYYIQIGLVTPVGGFSAADLAELRRVRRLMTELELNEEAVEVILRMRQRILVLEAELGRLRSDLQRRPPATGVGWSEAEWVVE